jgi:hypothetical protein
MSSSNRSHSDLEEIIGEFDRITPLDASTVRGWMATDDIEAAGALMSLLANPKQDSRINPPLRPEEYFEFISRYYERSMLENPDGEWADSTTTAGYDFARWFQRLWDDPAVPKSAMNTLKTSLARAYSAAPDTVRRNIVNSALEQLFQDSEILKYFADWKEDGILQSAYDEAHESVLARNVVRQKGYLSK